MCCVVYLYGNIANKSTEDVFERNNQYDSKLLAENLNVTSLLLVIDIQTMEKRMIYFILKFFFSSVDLWIRKQATAKKKTFHHIMARHFQFVIVEELDEAYQRIPIGINFYKIKPQRRGFQCGKEEFSKMLKRSIYELDDQSPQKSTATYEFRRQNRNI